MNRRIGPQSDDDTDLNGVEGELAFCKLMNLYPDLDIAPQAHTYDCDFGKMRVDVKTSKYKTARLLVGITKRVDDCDAYVLMIGENGKYECAGWCYSWAIVNQSCIIDLGYGKTYGMKRADLLAMQLLKEKE